MKTLSLFILTLLVLYNPKVQAQFANKAGQADVIQLQDAEYELDHNIILKKKNPLKDVNDNMESYVLLSKLFKEYQLHNIALSTALLEKLKNNKTFSGDDLYLIKRTFDVFYKMNTKMIEFGSVYQFKSSTMSKTFSNPENKLSMVKAHLIWLSSNLMVMDQMMEMHKILYATDGGFRRIFKNSIEAAKISEEDKSILKELTKQVAEVKETIEGQKFLQQITLVRSIEADLRKVLVSAPNALIVLDETISNNISEQIAHGKTKFDLPAFGLTDAIIGIFNKLTNWLSGVFGNIAGNVQWRKGYLFDNGPALDIAKNSLRPMDIILEKSPFVLTDKIIPGHYGHVAIYLGTRAQLEAIGQWNHPDIIPYQDDIEAGNTILEAVRPGVRLNSVEAFMNIDEMTIIHKLDEMDSPDAVAEQIRRGIDQMGKDYDFNFDISTLDKIVCSELIYIVFGNVSWPTRYRVGRPTVTPDDIAEVLFYKNTKFKVRDYLVSTERHRVDLATVGALADIFEYELRAENGEVIKDPKDPTNSFWKQETKCYNLADGSTKISDRGFSKTCKTTYKEFYYEELGHQQAYN
ncbi:MAG: hypothetical protein H7336_16290 [Bacteriovorax sp.]|nr:hypothetical protein [Bacteriovorax sp.]